MKNILIVVTNQHTLGDTNEKNGTFAPELTHALNEFLNAGYSYELASIMGNEAPIYGEDDEEDTITQKLLQDPTLQEKLDNTQIYIEMNTNSYDAIYFPGGFGLLTDLAHNELAAKITAQLYEKGLTIGAVCHGPAALLPVELSNGESILADKEVTGFTREEEIDYDTINKIPFLLEESLTRKAKKFTKMQPWTEHVITQDRLITGQNPASAAAVAKAMIARLEKS
ncbi:type 1 glutamine amidotransferase domain-containing protein [Flocculibacter collagenilyticus]|uniref:type 1 glutamine amidotransferase domain-containing protein n=1 Tax=Flocculibacter collagenilyticus TaxID=2744479 RepID=UPI0018F4BDC3|nr:type 1 glutamine amidotransferase domain-containing protein [Flocculibacter collagenilyticus]